MTFGEMKIRMVTLMRLAGYKDAIPAPDVGAYLNEALGEFTFDSEAITASVTFPTVIGQAEYLIPPPDFKYMAEALYDTGTSSVALGKSSEEDERINQATWTQRTNAQPSRWFVTGNNAVWLIPPPDVAGVTITVRGVRAAPDLIADTDEPAFARRFHVAVPKRAAILFAESFVNAELDMKVLDRYQSDYEGMVNKQRNVTASEGNASFQRIVRRRPARRVPLS